MQKKRPLEGILVLAVEQAVAAPLASCRLAGGGARVIKVERKSGDFARHYDRLVRGESAYFVWLNRNKESLVADIKQANDQALLHRILAKADVFIQNLAPGAAARSGLDSNELRSQYPQLITCDISGYGPTGPSSGLKAYDLLIQAESGVASITGTPDAPGRVGVSMCDIGTGLEAYASILEALVERQRSGQGSRIQVSLFDTMAEWMSVPLLAWDYSKLDWPRVGLSHPSIAPYGVYGLRGDDEILIAVQNDDEFGRLARCVVERPELGKDPRFETNPHRVENRAALDEVLRPAFASLERLEAVGKLESASIAYGFLNTVADLSQHPHLRRIEVDLPSGRLEMPAPPALVDDRQHGTAKLPSIGQHSASIRKEFA